MKSNEINIADNFYGMLKNLSADVKLDLITKISESLKSSHIEAKNDSWKKLYGAFKSDKDADEIINEIRSNRHTNRNIEDL
jgi:hypothetical protein